MTRFGQWDRIEKEFSCPRIKHRKGSEFHMYLLMDEVSTTLQQVLKFKIRKYYHKDYRTYEYEIITRESESIVVADTSIIGSFYKTILRFLDSNWYNNELSYLRDVNGL